MEHFDNFTKLNSINETVLELTGRNFIVPRLLIKQNYTSIESTIEDTHAARCFYGYYYEFGWQFLREKAEEINNDDLKKKIINLIDYCVFYDNEYKQELLEFLTKYALTEYYNVICEYFPFKQSSISKFIEENCVLIESKVFNSILVTIISFICDGSLCDTEDEDDNRFFKQIFNTIITHIIEIKETRNSSLFLRDFFQSLREEDNREKLGLNKLLNDMNFFPKGFNGKIQENGIIALPWKHVFFMNSYILIFHPNHPIGESNSSYRYEISESKKIYNQVSSAFIKKLPDIIAECKNGKVIKVLNIYR